VDLGGSTLAGTVGFASKVGDTFTILDNDGTDPVVGTFRNLPQKSTVTLSGLLFQVVYDGGTGNDVVLTRISTPPAFQDRTVTSPVLSGETVTVTGTITDPDPGDTFFLEVSWGDGTPAEVFTFPGSAGTVSVTHRYPGAALAQAPRADYVIRLAWKDEHGAPPRTAELPVTVFAGAPQRLVDRVYQDVLGRPAEPTGLTSWSDRLGQGDSPAEVAQFIAGSPEARARQVEDLYQALLGRSADPGGLAWAVDFLGTGGTLRGLRAAVLASEEYYQVRGGGTDAGFLEALYQDALHRPTDPSGRAAYGLLLAQGAPRHAVVLSILNSREAAERAVNDLYERLLGRAAEGQGLAFWTDLVMAGAGEEAVLAGIVDSAEYRGRRRG
jgi:hypothetical protein